MADIEVVEKIEETVKVKIPSMYKVLLHNDNTTTMDFVVMVLVKIFHRPVEDAISITMQIHHKGQGIAGSPYTKEIAEEKVNETVGLARANGYPLVATYEEL
jgi:ATP-dependent Clp protease adaptor protein ClpS